MLRNRAVRASLGAQYSDKIVMDGLSRLPLQVEIEDN
jgi:hypothetical protein